MRIKNMKFEEIKVGWENDNPIITYVLLKSQTNFINEFLLVDSTVWKDASLSLQAIKSSVAKGA